MARREHQRARFRDVRYRASQFFSVHAQAVLQLRERALRFVRESVGQCIQLASRPRAHVRSGLGRGCLRRARPAQAAVPARLPVDRVSVMFREV